MTKDGIVSGIIGIILCALGPFVDAGAIAEHAQRSPVGFALLLLGAILVGYFASCLVHYDDRKLREAYERERDEHAKDRLYIAKLEAQVASDKGISTEEVEGMVDKMLEESKPRHWEWKEHDNGNMSLQWKG